MYSVCIALSGKHLPQHTISAILGLWAVTDSRDSNYKANSSSSSSVYPAVCEICFTISAFNKLIMYKTY